MRIIICLMFLSVLGYGQTTKKVSELTAISENITQNANTYCYVSGNSYKITRDQLLGIRRYLSQGTSFTITKLAYSRLVSIDARATTGSATFKVGTSAGGSDIIGETTVTTTSLSMNDINRIDNAQIIIYVTVVSGNLNFKVQILNTDI